MPYPHLGAPYESGVTDHHKFWLDKRDVALQLEKQDSLNSSSFLDGKKGNWIVSELEDIYQVSRQKVLWKVYDQNCADS